MEDKFDFKSAFQRCLGWVTEDDLQLFRNTVVAIPGMGGAGGHHLHTLLRMGFSRFKIADPDHFELSNFNRQFGSSCSTIGKKKVEVLKNIALDINPTVEIETFDEGVNDYNLNDFLKGVDAVVDGIDLYAMDIRCKIARLAHTRSIPFITAAPIGMGTSFISFHPNKMSFDDYFDLNHDNLTVEAKIIRFLAGLTPKKLQAKYIVDPRSVKLFDGVLPSIHPGCLSASAAMAAQLAKIISNRGNVYFAPYSQQFDFFLNRSVLVKRRFGNRGLSQKALIKALHYMFKVQEFS